MKFWREIYKRENASGGPHVSGWIQALGPFLGDRGTNQPSRLAHFGAHWPSQPLEAITVASLPLWPRERFTDRQGVADEGTLFDRWGVEFPFAGTLVTLDGLQSSQGLVSIGTLSTNIATLAPLEGHATLVDIRAVASLLALRQLAFNHCDKLTDWSPLLALES